MTCVEKFMFLELFLHLLHTKPLEDDYGDFYLCSYTLYINKMKKEVGMLLQKSTDTRGVGISSMRKSIYLLKTTNRNSRYY